MAEITITHTRAEGTLLHGSTRGDGVLELLRAVHGHWRPFRSLGCLGLTQSRDKGAKTWIIDRSAATLRDAGHTVTVEVDDTTPGRSTAEREADAYEKAGRRAEWHAERAEAAAGRAEARFSAERQILDFIPPGQPILVGHHSEGRHRRDLARAENHMRRGIEELGKARHHTERAETAEHYQAARESVPVTLRRIGKLEAEARQIQRRLDGTDPYMNYGKPATGRWRDRLTARAGQVADELAYWRQHVKAREAEGVKVWSRADFTRGDFVKFIGSWYEVLRVNAKSVTIPAMISDGHVITKANSRMSWTDTIPYDKVTGRKSAEEVAAMLASPEQAQTA